MQGQITKGQIFILTNVTQNGMKLDQFLRRNSMVSFILVHDP